MTTEFVAGVASPGLRFVGPAPRTAALSVLFAVNSALHVVSDTPVVQSMPPRFVPTTLVIVTVAFAIVAGFVVCALNVANVLAAAAAANPITTMLTRIRRRLPRASCTMSAWALICGHPPCVALTVTDPPRQALAAAPEEREGYGWYRRMTSVRASYRVGGVSGGAAGSRVDGLFR